MKIYRKLILFCFLLMAGSVMAQQKLKFSIASFESDPFDMTAQNDEYKKVDGNGSLYAIIKVTSNNPDDQLKAYNFNFGNLRSIVEQHDQELWVYVQRNAKMVTISRQGYATVSRYDLRTTIEAGKTYVMQLSTQGRVVYTQMVQFTVEPANVKAVVMVKKQNAANEEMLGTIDDTGGVAKSLEFGSYTYRVMAENYHLSEGRFTLNDRKAIHTEKVSLKPNFSEITLTVDSEADIYVNEEKKGRRTWKGILKAGNYHVECRQTYHRSSSQYITVEENDNHTFTLTPPTPITGTLAITSRPLGASIRIDGRDYGKTPQNLNDMLIGRHTIELTRENYRPETQTVEVKENQTTNVEVQLNDIAMMTIQSLPTGATLYINGDKKGKTPYTEEMASGDYNIRLVRYPYRDYSKSVHLDSSNPEVTLKMTRQNQRPYSLYVQGSFQAGSMMGFGGNIGGYISNVNVEVGYTKGLGKETIYMNDGSNSSTCEVAPQLLSFRVGYGIVSGSRLRFTPQIGAGSLTVSGNEITGTAICGFIGVRGEFAFSSIIGLSLAPEYQFAVSKKDVYKQLSEVSSKIKGWGNGFNARLGLYLYF